MKKLESWRRSIPVLTGLLAIMLGAVIVVPNPVAKVATGLVFIILAVTYTEGALERQWQLGIWNRPQEPSEEEKPQNNQKLDYLFQQINPHFLYNTLESIRGKALADGAEEVADMTEALSSFFRYCIGRKSNIVTLADELHNVREYFRIQQFRFDNRFELSIHLPQNDDISGCQIPKLTLQPLVENAIVHGLESRKAKGTVSIRVLASQEGMSLFVCDDGVGIDTRKLEHMNLLLHSSDEREPIGSEATGIALKNIHNRIRLLFGENYGLTLYSTLGMGTTVEVRIPRIAQPLYEGRPYP